MRTTVLLFALAVSALTGCSASQQSPQPISVTELPDSDSVGAKALVKYCSDCHGTPLPDNHPAAEWSNVVYRMNLHRLKRALGEIPKEEKQLLIQYLQDHAADK